MTTKKVSKILKSTFLIITSICPTFSLAQNISANNLQDINLNGIIEILAFGDSITKGVGDSFAVGADVPEFLPTPPSEAGYPLRLENRLGVSVSNAGVRGEFLTTAGILRFAKTVSNSASDYVIIMEGANDTFLFTSGNDLRRDLQAMINMSKALGRVPVLSTIPTPCCEHVGSAPFVDNYNQQYRDLADLNQILIADSDKAFAQTCTGNKCFLFNLPDGLHPNTKGYDAMSEMIIATFFGIDLLGPGGNILLAQALGVDPSTIVVKSQPEAPTQTTP